MLYGTAQIYKIFYMSLAKKLKNYIKNKLQENNYNIRDKSQINKIREDAGKIITHFNQFLDLIDIQAKENNLDLLVKDFF